VTIITPQLLRVRGRHTASLYVLVSASNTTLIQKGDIYTDVESDEVHMNKVDVEGAFARNRSVLWHISAKEF